MCCKTQHLVTPSCGRTGTLMSSAGTVAHRYGIADSAGDATAVLSLAAHAGSRNAAFFMRLWCRKCLRNPATAHLAATGCWALCPNGSTRRRASCVLDTCIRNRPSEGQTERYAPGVSGCNQNPRLHRSRPCGKYGTDRRWTWTPGSPAESDACAGQFEPSSGSPLAISCDSGPERGLRRI
jgi:hypothetical protein